MNRRNFITGSLGLLTLGGAVTLSRSDGLRRYISHSWRHVWFDHATQFGTALEVWYWDENGDVRIVRNAARTRDMKFGDWKQEQNTIEDHKQSLAYWAEKRLGLNKEYFV